MKFILFSLLIIFINFFSVGQSLQFALNGDDWFTLWRYIKDFTTFQSHFDIKNFSTEYSNYVFANIIMGIIYRLFSFNPFPYYLVSIILRVITAISFYPAISAASQDKRAGFLSSIFFACMFAGIETTNWVFNMNTYISIALFNLFIYLYYSKDFQFLSKRGILTSSVLTSSFIVTQNRMHGLLFIIPSVDNMASLIDVLSSKESKELKRYGYNPVEIPLENVYAFQLQNKTLTNITPWTREYLVNELKK